MKNFKRKTIRNVAIFIVLVVGAFLMLFLKIPKISPEKIPQSNKSTAKLSTTLSPSQYTKTLQKASTVAPFLSSTAKTAVGYDSPIFPKTPPPKTTIDLNKPGVKLIPNYKAVVGETDSGTSSGPSTSESSAQLSNLPPEYYWWYGCSPTAAGMIMGWWHAQPGYSNLLAFDSSYWWGNGSSGPARMVASQADIDAGAALGYTYGSYQNHTADSLADFMQTENSSTVRSMIGPGMVAFANWDDPSSPSVNESFSATYTTNYLIAGWNYSNYKAEIDAGRPVHLGLTSTAGGHSVVGVGYDDSGGQQNYILWTTWSGWGLQDWQWNGETYSGYNFGVYAGTYLQITPQAGGDNPPVLAAIGNKSVDENSDLNFQISATDPDAGDTLTYSASNLPTGATFDPNTQTFDWTPSYTQSGTYANVHFLVTDGTLDDSKAITITVNNVDRPPVLSAIGNKTVDEGADLNFTLSASDPDTGDTLSYSVSNNPSGSTIGSANGTFDWTPSYQQSGTYTLVHFSVTDGTLSDSEDITITVNDVNTTPVLSAIGNKTVNEGQDLNFQISASDVDGDTLTYSVSNNPTGSTFTPSTRTFDWTPDYTQAGTYTLVHFEVSDGTLTDSKDITITVNNVDRPPVFSPISDVNVDENQSIDFSVSATDPDGDQVAFSCLNLPENAVFDPNTQTFSWTPSYLQSGIYHITFVASDSEVDVDDGITITVNNVPLEPFGDDTTAYAQKTYSDQIVFSGLKTSDCQAFLDNSLIADFGTTSWRTTINLQTGNLNYNIVYKNYLGETIDQKPINIQRNIMADINGDNHVNLLDLSIFANYWGQTNPSEALTDLNGDGVVNLLDLSIFANNWEK